MRITLIMVKETMMREVVMVVMVSHIVNLLSAGATDQWHPQGDL